MLMLIGILLSLITVLLFLILCTKVVISIVKKKPFPKKELMVTLISFTLVSSIYIYGTYFFTFPAIDETFTQKGPGPLTSPSGEFTANAYYEVYGGAAGGVNMRVEVTDNREDTMETVYFSTAMRETSVEWSGENKLTIINDNPEYPNSNRSVELEIGKEIYHENGLACQSLLMKDDYETCYQEKR